MYKEEIFSFSVGTPSTIPPTASKLWMPKSSFSQMSTSEEVSTMIFVIDAMLWLTNLRSLNGDSDCEFR